MRELLLKSRLYADYDNTWSLGRASNAAHVGCGCCQLLHQYRPDADVEFTQ
jgi:hypothetical protein